MKCTGRTIIAVWMLLVAVFLMGGCEQPKFPMEEEPIDLAEEIELGTTIGDLVEIFAMDAVKVEGFGIVDGLKGTGSSECPSHVREYLKQYILQHLPANKIDIDKFIDSRNTAVVTVDGIMPTAIAKSRYFDVRIIALPGTQTTSLDGGWLYGADLKAAGGFGMTIKVLAEAQGPVYIDKLGGQPNELIGYILAGGTIRDEYKIDLTLRQPSYRAAAIIRNKLNSRFSDDTAEAVSPDKITLKIPAAYKGQKKRFISIVKAIYLADTENIVNERIKRFVQKLAVSKESKDKYNAEIALEAIGNKCLSKLSALLKSSDERLRLQAARCTLNLGSDAGLNVLRDIAMDQKSRYRPEALEAIGAAARRNDAASISRALLRDSNFEVRLMAYDLLRQLDDISITQKLVARNFYLEQISQTEHKSIFVARSGQPKIVLFGTPLYCKDNIFIQSPDNSITINAPAGQDYVSIIRRHPKRPNVLIQLKSSFEVADIIQTLCEEPVKKAGEGPKGLNVSYSEMIALLKQMCEKGAIVAEYWASPLPNIGVFIKKSGNVGR